MGDFKVANVKVFKYRSISDNMSVSGRVPSPFNTVVVYIVIADLIDRPFEEKQESESEIAPVKEIRKGDLND